MLKLFIYQRLSGQADSKLLRLLLSDQDYEGKIFQKIPTNPFKNMVEFVEDVKDSDYILLAHEYYFVKHEDTYLSKLDTFAKSINKKIIVFDYGDVIDEVKLKNSVVLRTAGYRSELKSNEIVIPAFIEDLGAEYGSLSKQNKPTKPSVGFVGMVGLPSWSQEIKFQIRILIHRIYILLGKKKVASLQGLLFRRKIIKALNRSSACETNFIIRNSFSAHEKTLRGDPKMLRQEYVDTIASSDLNLIVRGDGNYSLRFFEVLSLGRIPLFIDTDTPLPFESEIPYDSFMLRIDHSKIGSVSDLIDKFWTNISSDEYVRMQQTARKVFETKLRVDVFYKILFDKLANEVRD